MPRPDIQLAGVRTRFQPGNRANPGGKPAGARNRLQGDFLRVLADDFAEHGAAAIAACREANPAEYLRIIATLMPRNLALGHALDALSDDELDAAIAVVRTLLPTVPPSAA